MDSESDSVRFLDALSNPLTSYSNGATLAMGNSTFAPSHTPLFQVTPRIAQSHSSALFHWATLPDTLSVQPSTQNTTSHSQVAPNISATAPTPLTLGDSMRTPEAEVTSPGDAYSVQMASPALQPPCPSSRLGATFPPDWIEIPQRPYDHGRKQLGFTRSDSVVFSTKNLPGFNLAEALRNDYELLNGGDDLMFNGGSAAISCRLLFPGYPENRGLTQIHTLKWGKARVQITRSKLAHEVAKRVNQYLKSMARITPDDSVEGRWRIGQGFMRIENMFLVRLVSVSRGSFQPEIWIAPPALAQARADEGDE